MDKNTYLLVLTIIIIVVIIFIYYYYYKNNYTKYINLMTPPPQIKTKYPLTEQAIMLNFPNDNYTISYSRQIYNSLLNENLKKNELKNILNSYPNSTDPFDLNCYVLHTPVFLPNTIKQQGQYVDSNGQVITNIENQDYYDIIGAYFFNNFNYFLGYDSQVYYYDNTKQIVIEKNDLNTLFNKLRADNSYQQTTYFIDSAMPTTLDKFVPKISMFLFYGLGVNISSKYVYQTMLSKCQ
jgi:hypothetical protein